MHFRFRLTSLTKLLLLIDFFGLLIISIGDAYVDQPVPWWGIFFIGIGLGCFTIIASNW